MKNEKLLHAIGKIDDELVVSALEVPSGKVVRRRNIRKMLMSIAACLCLVLAIPVVASQKDLLVSILSDGTGWSVHTQERFALEEFSRDVQKLSKELGTDSKILIMESVEEAEEFLGVPIPDNSLLAEAEKHTIFMETDANGQRERYEGHCMVWLAKSTEAKLVGVDTLAKYIYHDATVEVQYRMIPDSNIYENGGGISGTNYEKLEHRNYTTSSGRECAIFYSGVQGSVNYLYTGQGCLVVDGVLIELYIMDISEENVQNCMIELLDAFE